MKNLGLIIAGLLVFSLAGQAEAAAERKLPIAGQQQPETPKELSPNALPQLPSVPAEAFSLKGECSKEEARALDAVDDRFMDISDPDTVSLDRDQQETMEMLRDPEQLKKIIELYTKCGRQPSMHELDRNSMEQDMKDLEKANRQ